MRADTSQIPVPTQPQYPFTVQDVRLRPVTLQHYAILNREWQDRAQEGGLSRGAF